MNNNVRIGVEFEFTVPNISDVDRKSMSKWTEISTAYFEFDQYEDLYGRYIDGELEHPPEIPMYAKNLGYDVDDDIPDPDEVMRKPKNEFLSLVSKYLNIDHTWPFFNPIITADPDFKWSDRWIVKPDYSIGDCGFEVVSPLMNMDQFNTIMPQMFYCINQFGATTDDCGIHFSISFSDVDDLEPVLDINKLAINVDEDLIYQLFPNRKDNGYAISIRKDMEDNLNRGMKAFTAGHFMAVNLEHLGTDNEYVEFRYIGGKDYHKRWKEISYLVDMFIKALKESCNES